MAKKFANEPRVLKPKDFVGKTVKSVRRMGINHVRFTFTDGSQIAIDADIVSMGYAGALPLLAVIDP